MSNEAGHTHTSECAKKEWEGEWPARSPLTFPHARSRSTLESSRESEPPREHQPARMAHSNRKSHAQSALSSVQSTHPVLADVATDWGGGRMRGELVRQYIHKRGAKNTKPPPTHLHEVGGNILQGWVQPQDPVKVAKVLWVAEGEQRTDTRFFSHLLQDTQIRRAALESVYLYAYFWSECTHTHKHTHIYIYHVYFIACEYYEYTHTHTYIHTCAQTHLKTRT